MVPIPAIIAGLARLAPAVVPLLTRDATAEKAAQAVAEVARAVTGQHDLPAARAALEADPRLLLDYQLRLNGHALALFQAETARLDVVNQTIRAEVASADPYVRRMRPTFGYIMALAWLLQMGAIAYVIVADPAQAGAVIHAMAALSTIWSVGLAVLGIYVYKRSEDKKGRAGLPSPLPALAGLAQRPADHGRRREEAPPR